MKNMTIDNIAKACEGKICGKGGNEAEAACVVIDSRKMEKGGVFIAAKGERVDGHDFIPHVADMGALAVVCEKEPERCDIPFILVKDSFKALKDIAEFYRKQLDILVIGITGSVGKTSTKEMIASVVAQGFRVLKTEGNYNNEIGLPLTVLKIRPEHDAAVLEMGISNFGEMHRLSKIARPDICVITNIGQCHLENLGTREGILQAKSEIFDFMNPEGHIFINGDDDMLVRVKEKGSCKPVRFGLDPSNQVFASGVRNKGLLGSEAVFHISAAGLLEKDSFAGNTSMEVFPVEIPLPGGHMVYNALAAAAVGSCMGLSPKQIQAGIAGVQAVGGRSHVITLPSHTVIDDCYNANPVSMKAAIDLLTMALGRKVAILGDMFELGDKEKELHGEVGSYAVQKGIDVLICTGELSEFMYEAGLLEQSVKGRSKTELHYFKTREEMCGKLNDILLPGDSILVKASHGMQFEKVVEYLTGSCGQSSSSSFILK